MDSDGHHHREIPAGAGGSEPGDGVRPRWSLDVALAIVALAAVTVAIAIASFAFGGGVGRMTLPAAITLVAAVALAVRRRRGAAAVAAAAAILAVGGALGCTILDGSYDGQWFHREAVLQLTDGWNPLTGPLGPAEVASDNARDRINAYPLGPWVLGAAVYAVSGRIESASAFAVAFAIAALLAAFGALRTCGLSRKAAAAVAAVAAVGPVTIVQAVNQLSDGQVASVLLMILAAGLALHVTGSRTAAWLLCLAVVIGVNLKQSMPVLSVVLLGAGWAAARVAGSSRIRGPHVAAVVTAVAAGVLAVGFHPWITNVVRYQEPTYPYPQSAGSVAGATLRGSDLFLSMAARSVHAADYREARALLRSGVVKWPFKVSRAEIEVFRYEGVRVGGWGPLYSGMLVLGAAAFLLAARRNRRSAIAIALVGAGIVAGAVAHPESEVARLVPHVWLLPLLGVPLAMTSGRWARRAAWLTVATAAANVVLVGVGYIPAAVHHSTWLGERLRAIPDGSPVQLGMFPSNRVRLRELGVDVRRSDDPADGLDVYLGIQRPVLSEPRLDEGHRGTVHVGWSAVPGAVRYELELVLPPPRGPMGGALTAVRRVVPGAVDEAAVPAPRGPFFVTLAACNRLGCGVETVRGPLTLPVPARTVPVVGAPAPGATVSPALVMAWMPAADATGHRLEIADDDGTVVVDEVCDDRFFRTLLPPDRHWRATVTAIGAGGDRVAGRPVEFATGPLPAPIPRSGPGTIAGSVRLAWDGVSGATRYEYLITVPGRPPTLRDCTTAAEVNVQLPVRDDRATIYHAIVRACPPLAKCSCGSEQGWGPWSSDAGTGIAAVTVPGGSS